MKFLSALKFLTLGSSRMISKISLYLCSSVAKSSSCMHPPNSLNCHAFRGFKNKGLA